MKVVTLNFIERFPTFTLFNSILLDYINLPIEISLNGMWAWAVHIAVTIIRSTPLHSVLIICIRFNRQKQEIIKQKI